MYETKKKEKSNWKTKNGIAFLSLSFILTFIRTWSNNFSIVYHQAYKDIWICKHQLS